MDDDNNGDIHIESDKGSYHSWMRTYLKRWPPLLLICTYDSWDCGSKHQLDLK